MAGSGEPWERGLLVCLTPPFPRNFPLLLASLESVFNHVTLGFDFAKSWPALWSVLIDGPQASRPWMHAVDLESKRRPKVNWGGASVIQAGQS